MDKQFSKLLPDGYFVFENQVAGHNLKDGISPTGIIKSADGYVLKPVTKHPQSETEIGFYENLSKNKHLECFKKFVPEYKGTAVLNIAGLDITFLKLQDITKGFAKPCVMDVKIGKQTWDPNATEDKRKNEEEKYRVSKTEFGFCIPGYQVFDVATSQFNKMGKEEGRALDKQTLPIALKKFLNSKSSFTNYLLSKFLQRLEELLDVWKVQTEVHIYSSSLLFAYDAQFLQEARHLKPNEEVNNSVNIFMIDFAHVVPSNKTLDSNYIEGLKNLIKLLHNIKNEQ